MSSYPVINLMEDMGAAMANAQTEPPINLDGLALYPFLIWPASLSEDDRPPVNTNMVRSAVYSLWSSPHGSVFSKNHKAWHKLAFPEGAGEPRSDPVSAAFSWPALQGPVLLLENDWDSDTDRKSDYYVYIDVAECL